MADRSPSMLLVVVGIELMASASLASTQPTERQSQTPFPFSASFLKINNRLREHLVYLNHTA